MAVILIVEDELVSRTLVTKILRQEGYLVLFAKDGMAGVKAARERNPDLIVMDLGLPGMDGWEAARRIRLYPKTAHIPIVALTGSTLAENVLKAKQAGCDAYETKPVVYERLIAKIRHLLSTARPELYNDGKETKAT
jgi:two-component system response regulator